MKIFWIVLKYYDDGEEIMAGSINLPTIDVDFPHIEDCEDCRAALVFNIAKATGAQQSDVVYTFPNEEAQMRGMLEICQQLEAQTQAQAEKPLACFIN